jgi:endoglucanase
MCPLKYGLGSKFNETYFSEYEDAINYITVEKGVYALLDVSSASLYLQPYL